MPPTSIPRVAAKDPREQVRSATRATGQRQPKPEIRLMQPAQTGEDDMADAKPDPWTDEIEAEIFDRIAKGGAVRNILKDDWLPSAGTFYRRLDADAAFAERYARAKEQLADTIFDECLTIADSQEGDVYERDGVEMVNHDAIARAKLRIDTRKWMAGKLRPKVYGEKLDLSSSDGTMTPQIITRTIIDPKGDAGA